MVWSLVQFNILTPGGLLDHIFCPLVLLSFAIKYLVKKKDGSYIVNVVYFIYSFYISKFKLVNE